MKNRFRYGIYDIWFGVWGLSLKFRKYFKIVWSMWYNLMSLDIQIYGLEYM